MEVAILRLHFACLMWFVCSCRRPAGSELQVPTTPEAKIQSLPDHIGGFEVALPILSGIESKFGLQFPKFRSQASLK